MVSLSIEHTHLLLAASSLTNQSLNFNQKNRRFPLSHLPSPPGEFRKSAFKLTVSNLSDFIVFYFLYPILFYSRG